MFPLVLGISEPEIVGNDVKVMVEAEMSGMSLIENVHPQICLSNTFISLLYVSFISYKLR